MTLGSFGAAFHAALFGLGNVAASSRSSVDLYRVLGLPSPLSGTLLTILAPAFILSLAVRLSFGATALLANTIDPQSTALVLTEAL
jgi:hypothetical protein